MEGEWECHFRGRARCQSALERGPLRSSAPVQLTDAIPYPPSPFHRAVATRLLDPVWSCFRGNQESRVRPWSPSPSASKTLRTNLLGPRRGGAGCLTHKVVKLTLRLWCHFPLHFSHVMLLFPGLCPRTGLWTLPALAGKMPLQIPLQGLPLHWLKLDKLDRPPPPSPLRGSRVALLVQLGTQTQSRGEMTCKLEAAEDFPSSRSWLGGFLGCMDSSKRKAQEQKPQLGLPGETTVGGPSPPSSARCSHPWAHS